MPRVLLERAPRIAGFPRRAQIPRVETDDQVRENVRAELESDERLPHPDEIAVEAHGSEVTLRGTVGSFAQRRAAVADARTAVVSSTIWRSAC